MTFEEEINNITFLRPSQVLIKLRFEDDNFWKVYEDGDAIEVSLAAVQREIEVYAPETYERLKKEYPEEFI